MHVNFDVKDVSSTRPVNLATETKEGVWIALLAQGKLTDPYQTYTQLLSYLDGTPVITDHLYLDLLDVYWQVTASTNPKDIVYSQKHLLRKVLPLMKEYHLELQMVGWDRVWRTAKQGYRTVLCSSYLTSTQNHDDTALRPSHTLFVDRSDTRLHDAVPIDQTQHTLWNKPLCLQGPIVKSFPKFWKHWGRKVKGDIVWPLLDRKHLLYLLHHRGYLDYSFQLIEK